MKTLVILNCVDDAKHFIRHFKVNDNKYFLVSTLFSVNDYLLSKNIHCQNLAEYIEYGTITKLTQETDCAVDDLLGELDREFSSVINGILGTGALEWFYALYRYIGKMEYLGINKAYFALKKILETEIFSGILIYSSVPTSFFKKQDNLLSIVRSMGCSYEIIHNERKVRDYYLAGKRGKLRQIIRLLQLRRLFNDIERIIKRIRIHHGVNKSRNILLFLHLRDLRFLLEELSGKALVVDEKGISLVTQLSSSERKNLNYAKKIINDRLSATQDTDTKQIFLKSILHDFREEINHYLCVIKGLKLYHNKSRIRLGIWNIPPAWGAKAIMVHYLLKNKITVIGSQHGNCYCELDMDWAHFDSDFNWCDYFLSYGFTEKDLKEIYPRRKKLCKIIPSGHIPYIKINSHGREDIDLLYPLTIIPSFFFAGLRTKGDDLSRIQRSLLIFLNNYSGKRIVIKPLPFSNDKNSAVIWLLKKLKHLEVIVDLNMQQTIERYNIKSFLIDFPSNPLFEAMVGCKESEIFLSSNSIFSYSTSTQSVREEIDKRVYIFDEVQSLQEAIDRYFKGRLAQKRNEDYQRHYYERPNPQNNVLKLIEELNAK